MEMQKNGGWAIQIHKYFNLEQLNSLMEALIVIIFVPFWGKKNVISLKNFVIDLQQSKTFILNLRCVIKICCLLVRLLTKPHCCQRSWIQFKHKGYSCYYPKLRKFKNWSIKSSSSTCIYKDMPSTLQASKDKFSIEDKGFPDRWDFGATPVNVDVVHNMIFLGRRFEINNRGTEYAIWMYPSDNSRRFGCEKFMQNRFPNVWMLVTSIAFDLCSIWKWCTLLELCCWCGWNLGTCLWARNKMGADGMKRPWFSQV